jgi:hypothetical protein
MDLSENPLSGNACLLLKHLELESLIMTDINDIDEKTQRDIIKNYPGFIISDYPNIDNNTAAAVNRTAIIKNRLLTHMSKDSNSIIMEYLQN